MSNPNELYLESTDIVNWRHSSVQQLAARLAHSSPTVVDTAARCFEWVRDNILHSSDHQLNPVTCSASEVLKHGTGYCYAKSHLLAALLRANGIPAGFCYQRLSMDGVGPPFCVHGLNAVHLPQTGWYRVDARGNRDDLIASFSPPVEQLPFVPRLPGEHDSRHVRHEPLPLVLDALRAHATWDEMLAHLPDIQELD